MPGKNGKQDKPAESRPQRDEKGHFLPGNEVGKLGGRPRAIDFRAVAERFAKDNGVDLEKMVWDILQAMADIAMEGNVKAAHLILDRLCDPLQRSPAVNIDLTSNTLNVSGPPEGDSLKRYMAKLYEVAEKHGLIRKPEEVEDDVDV